MEKVYDHESMSHLPDSDLAFLEWLALLHCFGSAIATGKQRGRKST